jgi:hypothetical protein
MKGEHWPATRIRLQEISETVLNPGALVKKRKWPSRTRDTIWNAFTILPSLYFDAC